MNGLVEDVMTRLVLVVQPETRCEDMAEMMRSHRLRALPVVDPERHVLGIVTDTDLLFRGRTTGDRWAAEAAEEAAGPLLARDVMSVPPIVVGLETTLEEVTAVMRRRRIRHLPVVDRNGRLTGIVTPSDVLQKARSPSELDELAASWSW